MHLRGAITRFFHSARFIPSDVLWVSLTDSSHDALIISAVKNSQHGETLETILDVVQMRLNLIDHLATTIASSPPVACINSEAIRKRNPRVIQQRVARCLRLASFLLLNLPTITETKGNHTSVETFVKLISEYLRLVHTILNSRTDIDHHESKTSNDDFVHFFNLYLSVIGSKQPLNSAIEHRATSNSLTVKDFKALVSLFQEHISNCYTSITSQILETVSIFAARSEPSSLNCVIEFHWNATFMSKYTNSVDHMGTFGPPFVLMKILKSLSRSSPYGYSNATAEERYTHQTIMKLMKDRFNKSGERHLFLIHSMSRHWALLALSPRKITLFASFLETLLGKLVEFLKDVDNCLVGQKTDSKESAESSDDDDGEYIPPSASTLQVCKPSIPSFGIFMCLTSSSYPIFFDMVLRTAVSSISLFSFPEAMSRCKQPAAASYKLHPVYKLERMVAVYASLVKLYKDKFHIFPKFLLSTIINTSKSILDISLAKLQEYIEWRNYQPVVPPQDIDSRFIDPASTSFLKNLLDTFGIHVVGTLRVFCSVHSESTNALVRKVERTFAFLSQTSNRYNTGEIKTDNIVRDAPQGDQEGKDKILQSEHSTSAEESSEKELRAELQETMGIMLDSSLIRKRKSDRDFRPLPVEDYAINGLEDQDSFINDDDESSSSGSDAFGVSGDWGQGDGNANEEYDSKLYRSVRQIKITK
mmetsp:Transcript_22899/g.48024  ORF Transcript_22899/g.48024 Transcript_22899/m.48024 type:complete len:703 (-) Transcript_22899:27-2135(-)